MKNKKLILALAALVVVIGILACVYFATRPATQEGAKAYTVSVTHADGTVKDFSYRTDEEFLGAALQAEGLIQGTVGEFGLYVDTVDGETADYSKDGSYWALYEGEEYAMQGIDQTPVTDGGVYKLVYTVYAG